MNYVKPKKHLGQHFLKDENIAREIAESISSPAANVLEIGPGTGVLTKYLVTNPKHNLYVVEIDKESVDYLNTHYPQMKERIISDDFLSYPIESLFSGKEFILIGNFPYNISSQILFRVYDSHNQITEVVGMFQKEVAERIASKPGKKAYGILSVLLQAFYDIEYLFTVEPHVFNPPPKVQSAVIRLKQNGVRQLNCNETLFKSIIKTAFNQRRKTLRNALASYNFDHTKLPENIFSKRAEQLAVEDFVNITNAIIFTT